MPLDYSEKISRMAKRVTRLSEKMGKIELDPKGFFIILVQNEQIVIEHFKGRWENGQLLTGSADYIIEGTSAEKLCHTILDAGLISDLKHGAYLGRELQKAENALKNKKKYIQDSD